MKLNADVIVWSPLASSIAVAVKNLNEAIMEAVKNGLVIEAEVIVNEVTLDSSLTTDDVPEIRVQVFKELTEHINGKKIENN